MSYSAAIDQLSAMTPELYVRTGQQRRKFSLDEIRILLSALDDPQLRFPSVLIAGTNGKGSTAATLASILTASGLRTGLYTSPHLERVNERIRVNGTEITDEAFARLFFHVRDTAQQLVQNKKLPQIPSFFEVLTALAFLHFTEEHIEFAVLEVGMGGRLDATNVVDPLVSVITDISLDHTEWLGPTISDIAREKVGILRKGGTMIALPQDPEANLMLGAVAAELGARIVSPTAYIPPASTVGAYSIEALGTSIVVDSPLAGAHQHRNLALAIAAAVELVERHRIPVTATSVADGVRQTRWPGRLERLEIDGVQWILDVAHNTAGAQALRAGLCGALGEEKPRTLVFSCLRDKPVREMAQILFPLFEKVIVAPIHTARAATLDDLKAAAQEAGVQAIAADSVSGALEMAKQSACGQTIVISGSVYLVGEALSLLHDAQGEQP
jgi:dihydrofolate synthase/folylpolyglutamate synthase